MVLQQQCDNATLIILIFTTTTTTTTNRAIAHSLLLGRVYGTTYLSIDVIPNWLSWSFAGCWRCVCFAEDLLLLECLTNRHLHDITLHVMQYTLPVFEKQKQTCKRPTETTLSSYGRKRNCRRNYIISFGWNIFFSVSAGRNRNHAETVITVSAVPKLKPKLKLYACIEFMRHSNKHRIRNWRERTT